MVASRGRNRSRTEALMSATSKRIDGPVAMIGRAITEFLSLGQLGLVLERLRCCNNKATGCGKIRYTAAEPIPMSKHYDWKFIVSGLLAVAVIGLVIAYK